VFENSKTLRLEGGEIQTGADNTLTFDYCVLASGSSPAKIPAFDLGSDRVMDSTGALELKDVPESLLVVGGGYIGLEMGSVYAHLGSKVTVVELLPGLLMGADRDLVAPLAKRLGNLFAGIYLETKVASMALDGEMVSVTFEAADGVKRTEKFSRVLVSVGRKPNSQGIGLEKTKVEIDKKGFVKIDKQQRNADPHNLPIGHLPGRTEPAP